MDKLFEKISSYNLFNYLLPGLVFGWIFVTMKFVAFPTDNLIAVLVAAYALGLLISRLGSLILEPIFKRMKFLSFSNYSDYVYACDNDQKIETLVEQANSYRTFLAGFLLVVLAYPVIAIADQLQLTATARSVTLLISGVLVFAWSYKKQSDYVSKRVSARTARKA